MFVYQTVLTCLEMLGSDVWFGEKAYFTSLFIGITAVNKDSV